MYSNNPNKLSLDHQKRFKNNNIIKSKFQI